MRLSRIEMTQKLDITVDKTIEAIARIQRFIIKYGLNLREDQLKRISDKLKELQEIL
ncbi:MAG: hypothetical protein BWY24_00330 [Microgenomates group bacterium ADurb.Bin219]|nr:MAG: hypothetical protein BWY24_00330 [Microgenomates group bacterium ADurb.Bin219]